MRITSLTLERYGSYTQRRLEFGPGLTVVTGPNEAGKSTLLDALSDLFWGFPRPARHAYAVAVARLEIGGTVLVGGAELQLRRTTRGLTGDMSPIVEPVWGPGGVEARRAWRQSFGLSHAELRAGGQALCGGGGDLAELVFTARSGRDVHAILARITEEAERLYKPHKGSKAVEVRAAMTRFEQTEAQIQQQMAKAADVEALTGRILRLQAAATAADRERHHARTEARLAQQRVRAFRHAVDLAELHAALTALLGGGAVLDPARLTELDAATGARDAAVSGLAALRTGLDAQRRKRGELRVDDRLLADAVPIRGLDQAHQARVLDDENVAALTVQASAQRRAAEHAVAELTGPDERPVDDRLAALHVPADRCADLDQLAERVREAERTDEVATQAHLAALRKVRDGAGGADGVDAEAARRVGELRRAIEAEGSALSLHRTAVQDHTDALGRLRDALSAAHRTPATTGSGPEDADHDPGARGVGPRHAADPDGAPDPAAARQPGGDADPDRATVPEPPSADRMAELRNRVRSAAAAADGAERDRGRAEERVQEAGSTLAALAAEGALPGADELTRARADRDGRLDEVLAVLRTGGEPHALAAAAVALQRSVDAADRVADQLITGADRVAELGRRQAEVRAAEEGLAVAARSADLAERDRTFAETQWTALWVAVGVSAPEPDAADEVRRALEDAHRAESERWHARSRIDGLAAALDGVRARLGAALAAAGRDRPGADLDTLLVVAADLESAADAARDRRTLLVELRDLARRAGAEADARRHDRADVVARWRFALNTAGLPSDTDPAGWAVRRDRIAEARRAHGEARRLDDEVAGLQERLAAHRAAVAELAERHGARGPDPATTLADLVERVQDAERASVSARHHDDEIARIDEAVRATDVELEAAEAVRSRIARDLELDPEQLAAAAHRGRERIELDGEDERLRALLRSAGPDLDLDDLVGGVGERDQDGLDRQAAQAELAAAELDAGHTELVEQLGGLRRDLGALEDREPAATLRAVAQEHLARAAEAAERYLVVQLQREILRRELVAYERQHSSRLLTAAGELLERLTEGRFVALRPATDDGGRSLSVVRADGEEQSAEQLSEGTADQLYLALRLAGIGQLQDDRAEQGLPPVPVVLDDVLMTFDDTRAAAAVAVLTELSAQWQILLFTHHDHLARIAEQTAGPLPVLVRLATPEPIEQLRDPDLVRAEPARSSLAPALPAPRSGDPDTAEIRAWARANGHEVGERGRIPAELREAYNRRA